MNWEQKKNKSRRQRRRHSKNAYRKWKRSLIEAANAVVLELVQLADPPSWAKRGNDEAALPSDG